MRFLIITLLLSLLCGCKADSQLKEDLVKLQVTEEALLSGCADFTTPTAFSIIGNSLAPNQSTLLIYTIINIGDCPNDGNLQVFITRPDFINFITKFDPDLDKVHYQGDIVPIGNTEWDYNEYPAGFYFQTKDGVEIGVDEYLTLALEVTANGAINSKGNSQCSIYYGSGGDNKPSNNHSIISLQID